MLFEICLLHVWPKANVTGCCYSRVCHTKIQVECSCHSYFISLEDLVLLEAMWVEIKAGHNIIHVCVCYQPPNAKAEFCINLQDSLALVKQSVAVLLYLPRI